MARIKYTTNAFSVGVISESVKGNNDFEKYNNALDICENFVIQPTGGAFKRGGTVFIAETKYKTGARLILFSYDIDNQYILEFGDQYIRFYSENGQLINNNAQPVEITTPFSMNDVNAIKTFQDGNTLIIISPLGMFRLERTGTLSFSNLQRIEFTTAPMGFIDDSRTVTLVCDKTKGGRQDPITIKVRGADGQSPSPLQTPLFLTSDVNNELCLIYRLVDESIGRSELVRYYLRIVSVEGDSEVQNQNKVRAYIESEKCWNELDELPNLNPVFMFQIGEFTPGRIDSPDVRGMPKAAAIFEGRLFLGGSKFNPLGIWASGNLFRDWTDFYLGSDPTDSIQYPMRSIDSSAILWMIGQSKLFIGTSSGVYVAGAATFDYESATPSNFNVRLFASSGASMLQPIAANDIIFYTDASDRHVHRIALSGETGFYKSDELSELSADLFTSGITKHAWQQTPINTYWCTVEDGYLCSFTYSLQNGVLAWTKQIIAGKNVKVEDVCVMKGKEHDLVWLVVRREVGNEFKRYIEYISPPYNPKTQEEFEQYYVDCGKIFTLQNEILTLHKGANHHISLKNMRLDLNNKQLYVSSYSKYYGVMIEGIRKLFFMSYEPDISMQIPYTLRRRFFYKVQNSNNVNERAKKLLRTESNDIKPNLKVYVSIGVAQLKWEDKSAGKMYLVCQHANLLKTGDQIVLSGFAAVNERNKMVDEMLSQRAYYFFVHNGSKIPLDYTFSGQRFIVQKTGDQIRLFDVNKQGIIVGFEGGKEKSYVFRMEIYKECGEINESRAVTETYIDCPEAPNYWTKIHNDGLWHKVYLTKIPGMLRISAKDYYIHGNSIQHVDNKYRYLIYEESGYPTSNGEYHFPLDIEHESPYDDVSTKKGSGYLYFTEISIPHLAGQQVQIQYNGNAGVDTYYVPETGRINIQDNTPGASAMYACVGLQFIAKLKTTPFSGGCVYGSSIGSVGASRYMWLYLYYSLGGRYGTDIDNTYPIQYQEQIGRLNIAKSLVTGILPCPVVDSKNVYERSIYVEHSEPLSFNVLSITQDLEVSDE